MEPPPRYNGIRRQNVADHTLSKLLAFNILLPSLQNIFGKNVDYDLLFTCIMFHDFGEYKRRKNSKTKSFDILVHKKVPSDDVAEYERFMELLGKCDLGWFWNKRLEEAFILQYILTTSQHFPVEIQSKMIRMKRNKVTRNTAILFQILEKWEYLFYGVEHKDKHPTILKNVVGRNAPVVIDWINWYPEKYHKKLHGLFVE